MKALSIKNLRKTYPNGVEALKGIDLDVEEGDFFSLLGPNGAGKSTTIGIITSLVNKTSGKVKVFSHDIDHELEAAKRYIGLVPQEFNFNIFEKVIDIIVCQAGYYGIPLRKAQKRAEKYLKQLGLWEKRNHKAMMLSGGLKRRMMIVRALVHEPKLLILDEPTAGVDIELRRSLWKFIVDINKKGITIILTTHYLEEAESLANNIAIIDHGIIKENTSKKELLAKLEDQAFIFDLKNPINKICKCSGYEIKKIDDTCLEVNVKRADSINKLFEYFSKNNIEVVSMRNKTNRLEELFINLTKK